jgi:CheY-like chemotaxis protein
MNEQTLKQARILMLDDQVGSTCLMENFLHRLGYSQLQSLNDSTQMFELVESFEPDLILLDLAMPGSTASRFSRCLRKGRPPTIRSRSSSSPAMRPPRTNAAPSPAGATDLLAKPFDPSRSACAFATFSRRVHAARDRGAESPPRERVRERTLQLENALENLQAAQRQMLQQERLSAFGEMAGGVVHDFSNALMSIIGYSDQLLRNPARAPKKRPCSITSASLTPPAAMERTSFGRLRDFYRPRGAADMFETLDLNEIASQSIALAKPRSASRGATRGISYAKRLRSWQSPPAGSRPSSAKSSRTSS